MCKAVLPASAFYKHPKSGLQSRCKECTKRESLAAYKANPEYWRKRVTQWRRDNRVRLREYDRQWRAANPDRVASWRPKQLERSREYWKTQSQELTDGHVRRMLADSTNHIVKPADFPFPLVELKRAEVQLKRELTKHRDDGARVCECCGKAFQKKKGRKPDQGNRYCSRECAFKDIRSWHHAISG